MTSRVRLVRSALATSGNAVRRTPVDPTLESVRAYDDSDRIEDIVDRVHQIVVDDTALRQRRYRLISGPRFGRNASGEVSLPGAE